ncbi:MAG: hypothetical protein AB7E80_14950 [Hyphomicrobiaceae bacterium]
MFIGAHPHFGTRRRTAYSAALLALLTLAGALSAAAQQQPGWQTDLSVPRQPPAAPDERPAATPAPAAQTGLPAQGSTIVKKTSPEGGGDPSQIKLVALLTADGQRIEQDLVWRVFAESKTSGVPGKLLITSKEASPTVRLPAGSYMVNAAFGRAHVTRRLTVADGVQATEPFVLNAGGLRVTVAEGTGRTDANKVHFDIMTDERDQLGNRALVLAKAKPGVVIRLNSGIYRIVSTYGDANASLESDVTVEAGKLTEATVAHKSARVTLKLVTREGGEALPDAAWSILTDDGQMVRESVGALPSHVLAPGSYLVVARSQGRVFRRQFSVSDGDVAEIEVLKQ